MSVLHAKFGVKTVMNEEIPVNEWQKKIKNVKVGRNDVYSIKFWVRLKCFPFVFPHLWYILHIGKAQGINFSFIQFIDC